MEGQQSTLVAVINIEAAATAGGPLALGLRLASWPSPDHLDPGRSHWYTLGIQHCGEDQLTFRIEAPGAHGTVSARRG